MHILRNTGQFNSLTPCPGKYDFSRSPCEIVLQVEVKISSRKGNVLLSKPKLSVLRRLASEGVVREGLHLAVNGLVDDGFVVNDDGFMLSEKGAAVLYLYDNVTDIERGLLMRMYRAHCDGRKFSVDEDSDLVAGDLMIKNLVDGRNANIWLTDYALEAWAGWVEFLNERQKYNEQQKRYQAKKKAEARVIEPQLPPLTSHL